MRGFFSLSPNELILLATTISLQIAEVTDADQQNVLGNFFGALSSNLQTIAAQAESLKSASESNSKKGSNSSDDSSDDSSEG
ncbi:hypothetical protein [Clostridium cylindrosporum]|uniref:Uncharacterized protein n=1 Tax=Clostridium cylindrosporum DSM 605 TaxID=1121307 RepID=A0A0J8DFJ2_CLOCY|nr:hypothetical protein [Clostridium cylindrosporum]KMT22948.1 hypothetical protein CLCY_5c01870 [Clostridium cylindrosporum DSM 605]